MMTVIGVRGLSVALLLAGAGLTARAASFSAELVDTRGGETHIGTFNYQDQSYRFEVPDNGPKLVITANGKSGVTHLLVPEEKVFVEAGPEDPRSHMMSPFAFYAHYVKKHGVKAEGTEKIGGIACTKQVVSSGEQVFVLGWFSEEFGFPLRVEIPLFARTVELRNIKRGPQAPTLFIVPADYKPAPAPEEEPPPEWAAQVPQAPVLSPPFEQNLQQGKIVRLQPQSGRQIRVTATNPTQEPCAFTGVGFKGGRPTSDISGNTVNLNADDVVTMTFSDPPAEADDLVIRVRSGTVRIKAEFVPAAGAAPADATASAVEDSAEPAAASTPTTAAGPAPTSELTAEIAAPKSAGMASRFEVRWSGPANPEDYISVARLNQPPGSYLSMTRVREGNPLKVWAPSDPGDYEVRYIVGRGAKLLARSPITIKPVTAGLEATGPVKVAGWIDVQWEGPGNEADYISVARPDQPPGACLERASIKQGLRLRVRAPSDPGDYEVRYILGRGPRLIAKTPIVVEPVVATVEAPATAKTGADFEVRWSGPGYHEDLVVVARLNQSPGSNVGSKPTRTGNPVKLRAPKEPGSYEIRYILGHGHRSLATARITIEAP